MATIYLWNVSVISAQMTQLGFLAQQHKARFFKFCQQCAVNKNIICVNNNSSG